MEIGDKVKSNGGKCSKESIEDWVYDYLQDIRTELENHLLHAVGTVVSVDDNLIDEYKHLIVEYIIELPITLDVGYFDDELEKVD